jgi:hypothetical protein
MEPLEDEWVFSWPNLSPKLVYEPKLMKHSTSVLPTMILPEEIILFNSQFWGHSGWAPAHLTV